MPGGTSQATPGRNVVVKGSWEYLGRVGFRPHLKVKISNPQMGNTKGRVDSVLAEM